MYLIFLYYYQVTYRMLIIEFIIDYSFKKLLTPLNKYL